MSDMYNESPAMMAARGQVAKGQTYGKRKQQEEALRAVPMGPSAAQTARPRPAAPGSFTAPSTRPMEPITAGAPFGEGPGPMGAGIPMLMGSTDEAVIELRQIAEMFRSEELIDLLDAYESQT